MSGVGDVAFNIVTGDVDQTYDHVMLFVGTEPLLPSYAAFCHRNGVPFEVIHTMPRTAELYAPLIAARLMRIRPDIVIVHGGLPGLVGAVLSRCRILFVEHQPIPVRNRRDRFATLCASRQADATVVLSQGYQAYLREAFGDTVASRTVIIENGIDIADFSANPILTNDRSITIGMAARFHGSKRFDLLVEMLAELQIRRPTTTWRLSLAGDGPNLKKVQAQSVDLNLQDSISFEGMVSKADLPEWFRALDIYAHASDGEVQSIALLQAMAIQLPIVGSDVPGIRDLLDAEEPCGLLAVSQTGSALADAVIALIDKPSATHIRVKNAHMRIIANNSNSAMFKNYKQLIERMVS